MTNAAINQQRQAILSHADALKVRVTEKTWEYANAWALGLSFKAAGEKFGVTGPRIQQAKNRCLRVIRQIPEIIDRERAKQVKERYFSLPPERQAMLSFESAPSRTWLYSVGEIPADQRFRVLDYLHEVRRQLREPSRENPATKQQPEPRPGERPVMPEMRRLLDEREQKGIETYGRPLETFNGRSSLRDATEEVLDQAQYLVQLRMELEAVDGLLQRALMCELQWKSSRQYIEQAVDRLGEILGRGDE